MKKSVVTLISALLLLIVSNQLYATWQNGDKFIVDGDTVSIRSYPLEEYFKKKWFRKIGRVKIKGTCSALWRGYVATWELKNDSLFLVRVQTDYCGGNPVDVDLYKEFKQKRVFAKWVNSSILKTYGELLNYLHFGRLSIHEGKITYSFRNGVLAETIKEEHFIRDDSSLFPGERFLHDTIKQLILKQIPLAEREGFNENDYCLICVSFQEDGSVGTAGICNGIEPQSLFEKTIDMKTKEVLNNLPKLMKLKYEGYTIPDIQLLFKGYCLKNPQDREYGCRDE